MLQKFEKHHPKETIFYSYPHTAAKAIIVIMMSSRSGIYTSQICKKGY